MPPLDEQFHGGIILKRSAQNQLYLAMRLPGQQRNSWRSFSGLSSPTTFHSQNTERPTHRAVSIERTNKPNSEGKFADMLIPLTQVDRYSGGPKTLRVSR